MQRKQSGFYSQYLVLLLLDLSVSSRRTSEYQGSSIPVEPTLSFEKTEKTQNEQGHFWLKVKDNQEKEEQGTSKNKGKNGGTPMKCDAFPLLGVRQDDCPQPRC